MKLIALSLLLLLSFPSHSDDMLDYMDVTDNLIRSGNYKEALKRTLWFHNHSTEHQRSIDAVRLSFAIQDWYKFGNKYAPAMEALLKVRDTKTNILLSGSGSYELFEDVAAINDILSEDDKTIDLFNNIKQKQPDLAKECWYIVKDIAITEKNISLLKQYNTNVLTEYFEAEQLLNEMLIRFDGEDDFIKMNKDMFVEKTLELIELSVSTNDNKTAILIKNKAKNMVSDIRLNNASAK